MFNWLGLNGIRIGKLVGQIVLIGILGATLLWALDVVQIKLTDSAGGSNFAIQNDGTTSVFQINSLGSVISGTWQATTIAIAKGGTNNTSFSGSKFLYYDGSKIAESLYYNTDFATSTHTHTGTYEPAITAGTSAQYWRGDKTWQTLNQAAVAGLTTGSSPTFAGLTVGLLGGYIKGSSGVLSGQTGVPYTDLTYSGLSTGQYLRATGTSAASFSTIPSADLGSGTADSTTYLRGDRTWQIISGGGDMLKSENLSGLTNYTTARTNLLPSKVGNTLKVLRVNAGETDYELATPEAFPVGSVFISVVSTTPATLLGYGTWTAFVAGRVLVGLDSGDTDFDVVEKTGGAKTVTSDTTMIPAHSHGQNLPSVATGNFTCGTKDTSAGGTGGSPTTTADAISTANAGGGLPHPNVQPYIVVYFWKRVS